MLFSDIAASDRGKRGGGVSPYFGQSLVRSEILEVYMYVALQKSLEGLVGVERVWPVVARKVTAMRYQRWNTIMEQ